MRAPDILSKIEGRSATLSSVPQLLLSGTNQLADLWCSHSVPEGITLILSFKMLTFSFCVSGSLIPTWFWPNFTSEQVHQLLPIV